MQKKIRPWWRKPWVGSSAIGVAVAFSCGFASALPAYDIAKGESRRDFGLDSTQQYSSTPTADDFNRRGYSSAEGLHANGYGDGSNANTTAGFANRTDEFQLRLPKNGLTTDTAINTRRNNSGRNSTRNRAANFDPTKPSLAIIIDDLGYHRSRGLRAAKLKGPLTLAVLPQTPHGRQLARVAKSHRNEVILHQPLQPTDRSQDKNMGRGGMTVGMSADAMRRTLEKNLASLPDVDGVSNHMGSLFTRDAVAMNKLVGAVRDQLPGAYFVDSLTSPASVAANTARQSNLRTTRRDFFLDHVKSEKAIARQLRKAIRLAKKEGTAIAIGHPYPETLKVLERELPRLRREGVQLVTVSDIIARRSPRKNYSLGASSIGATTGQAALAKPVNPDSAIAFSQPDDLNKSLRAKLGSFGL